MKPLTATILCILVLLLVMAGTTRTPMVPVQKPWTEQEQLCADLMKLTEHGDQYTDRERLRMCRVYIDANGGFEND